MESQCSKLQKKTVKPRHDTALLAPVHLYVLYIGSLPVQLYVLYIGSLPQYSCMYCMLAVCHSTAICTVCWQFATEPLYVLYIGSLPQYSCMYCILIVLPQYSCMYCIFYSLPQYSYMYCILAVCHNTAVCSVYWRFATVQLYILFSGSLPQYSYMYCMFEICQNTVYWKVYGGFQLSNIEETL